MVSIRDRMLADHERLGRSFEELTNVVEGADAPTLVERWTAFERGVAAHLDAEEQYLFPALEQTHRGEIAGLKNEHERIRTAIAELGIRVDLHTLRESAAAELIAMLRAHAEREDAALYRWADELGDATLGGRVLDALARQGRNVI